jgi:hypothetical protein
MAYVSYEYLAEMHARRPKAPSLLEGWRGTQIVAWYGSIERQLVSLHREAQAAENKEAETKIYAYLKVWRENELTGSVNVETVKTLKAGADMLAVDQWNLGNYFSQLRDQLRRLIASLEELPAEGFDATAASSFSPRSAPTRLEPPSTGNMDDLGLPAEEPAAEEPAAETPPVAGEEIAPEEEQPV